MHAALLAACAVLFFVPQPAAAASYSASAPTYGRLIDTLRPGDMLSLAPGLYR